MNYHGSQSLKEQLAADSDSPSNHLFGVVLANECLVLAEFKTIKNQHCPSLRIEAMRLL